MAIAPALLPELLAILQSDEYGPALQQKALAILHTVLEVLQVGLTRAWAGLDGGARRCRWMRLPASQQKRAAGGLSCTLLRTLHPSPPAHVQELASGATLVQVKALLSQALPGWLAECARLLAKPLQPDVRALADTPGCRLAACVLVLA